MPTYLRVLAGRSLGDDTDVDERPGERRVAGRSPGPPFISLVH
jgi:hypothetical protein